MALLDFFPPLDLNLLYLATYLSCWHPWSVTGAISFIYENNGI